MEIYVHSTRDEEPRLVVIEASATVSELVGAADGEETVLIWLEEADEPLELEITLEDAGARHRHHVHRGRCRRVEVRVRYGGRDAERSFSPAATIERAFAWATGPEVFNLTAEERAKHVLALPGADHFLAWTVHVGSVVEAGTCATVLELAPKERFEG
jgi:hypothetical protein